MSLSPSYLGDTASASPSPESPREGDFSPPQFYDNLKSLEEQEICDDKRDPIVNSLPDNNSSCLFGAPICASLVTNDLEKECAGISPQEQIEKSHKREARSSSTSSPSVKKTQSGIVICNGSPERHKRESLVSTQATEACTLDGRCVTLVNTQTQTDWEWVEQALSFFNQVQKEVEDLQLQAEMNIDTLSLKETDETSEECDIRCTGLPRLIAHKPEPKQTKVAKAESKDVHLAHCEYCQKLCQLFTNSELLENETHFEKLFCCEQAKQIRELIKEEREKLAQIEADRKIDTPIMIEERKPRKGDLDERSRHTEMKHKSYHYRLSKEIRDETHISQINIRNVTGMFTRETEPKIKEVIQKFYKSGRFFLISCPDGTGSVFYPSGKPAIIVSSAEADDFTHIILEDKDTAPSIKGIFTNKGHCTCYHPNGNIWLNLTPDGGLCFSESGDLKRRWSWLYFDPHVCNLPFKPLIFTLGPHISVRIHSQEHMYVTFGHQHNMVRFNVGSKLKRICLESHDKPGQGVLEQYVQMKSTEIYSLLDQMQTCVSRPSANLHNVKPHYRFIARKQRLSKQMKKEKSPEKMKYYGIFTDEGWPTATPHL